MHKRNIDDDDFLGDEGIDDEAQKDEGNDIPVVGVIQTVGKEYTPEPGQSVRLACVVNPANVPVVNWYRLNGDEDISLYMNTMKMMKQDNPLYNRTRIISEGGVHDLVIDNVQPSDAGEYRCQLPQTEPTSVVHRLKYNSKPKIINLEATNNGTVTEGSDLVLTCRVEATPTAQILWSRVSQGSESGNVRLGENDGEFTFDSVIIRKVKAHHSGLYYCYAFNSLGQSQAEINVYVLEKPHAHVHKKEINTGVGAHAVFQCATRGSPVPLITWFKDNVPIVENDRFMISTEGSHSNLTVVPASVEDFGTYTCVAQNYHGVHNRSAELVQRPVVDDVDVKGPKLSFRVHSHLPLEHVEIQLMDQNGNIHKLTVPKPEKMEKSYSFAYEVSEDLLPGSYQAFIRAKNENDWSRNTDPIKMNIEAEPINIQRSSIYRTNDAPSIRHSGMFLSTAFMYLLIRTL